MELRSGSSLHGAARNEEEEDQQPAPQQEQQPQQQQPASQQQEEEQQHLLCPPPKEEEGGSTMPQAGQAAVALAEAGAEGAPTDAPDAGAAAVEGMGDAAEPALQQQEKEAAAMVVVVAAAEEGVEAAEPVAAAAPPAAAASDTVVEMEVVQAEEADPEKRAAALEQALAQTREQLKALGEKGAWFMCVRVWAWSHNA